MFPGIGKTNGRERKQESHYWELQQSATTHQTVDSGGREKESKKNNSQEAAIRVLSPCSLHPSFSFLRTINEGQTKELQESSHG